jgi:PTH1 family peptidyl-tRNA hydrolase
MGITFSRRRSHALVSDGRVEGTKVIVAKPQTFMNLSGQSVGSLVRFYRIPLPQLLVVCDDLDLPLGVIRLRPGGGSAGHKGLRSIFEHLGTQEFPRLRIGIGRPPGRMDPADYVLQDFGEQERALVDTTLERAEACVCLHVRQGIQAAMTQFNTPPD